MAVPQSSESPCEAWESPAESSAALDRHRVVHRGALADAPVVDVAAGVAGRDGVHHVGLGGRQAEHAEVGPDGHPDVLEHPVVLLHGPMVDRHAGVVDRLVHDPGGIGLRRPAEVVDAFRPVPLAARVDLVDGDHLARLGIGQQLLVVEAPPGRRVAPEALALVLRVGARPRPDVDDPDLEDVSRLGLANRDRARADVDAEAFAGAPPEERRVHRAGAAPVHALALLVPVEDALRARIALHHAVGVVVGVVREHLDRDEVTGAHLDLGLEQLAEIPPVHRLVGRGHVVVVLGARHHPGLRVGRRHRRDAGRRERRRRAAGDHGALEEFPPPFVRLLARVVALAFARDAFTSPVVSSPRHVFSLLWTGL